jgi:regulatory protein
MKQYKQYKPRDNEKPDLTVILEGTQREKMQNRARNVVIFQLSDGPRSRKQLEDRLSVKKVPLDIQKEILDQYTSLGLINDSTFAINWTESRHRSKGLSRMAIKQELKYKKGLGEEDIATAMETLSDEDEYVRALELVTRKAPSTRRLEPQARTRRLVGMLARKGYSGSLAYRVVKEVLALEEPDPDFAD